MHEKVLRIVYPLRERAGSHAGMVLRTASDWSRDVPPTRVDPEGAHEFRVTAPQSWLSFKPCLRTPELVWSQGTNRLALLTGAPTTPQTFYPWFFPENRARLSHLIRVPSPRLGRDHRLRVFLPPGYEENHWKRYPVLFVHDGANLFFPEEAFLGQEWRVDETLERLNAMQAVDEIVCVGIHAADRMREYTAPGYHAHGEALVQELLPWVKSNYRILDGPEHTGILGSSLGGVASFFVAWQWPQIFGMAGCLSATFGYADDLLERVLREPRELRPNLRLYLDSGWPGDNFERTQSMAHALLQSGFVLGRDLTYYAFPHGRHDEQSWGDRLFLPLQVFAGKLRRYATTHAP